MKPYYINKKIISARVFPRQFGCKMENEAYRNADDEDQREVRVIRVLVVRFTGGRHHYRPITIGR